MIISTTNAALSVVHEEHIVSHTRCILLPIAPSVYFDSLPGENIHLDSTLPSLKHNMVIIINNDKLFFAIMPPALMPERPLKEVAQLESSALH